MKSDEPRFTALELRVRCRLPISTSDEVTFGGREKILPALSAALMQAVKETLEKVPTGWVEDDWEVLE